MDRVFGEEYARSQNEVASSIITIALGIPFLLAILRFIIWAVAQGVGAFIENAETRIGGKGLARTGSQETFDLDQWSIFIGGFL